MSSRGLFQLNLHLEIKEISVERLEHHPLPEQTFPLMPTGRENTNLQQAEGSQRRHLKNKWAGEQLEESQPGRVTSELSGQMALQQVKHQTHDYQPGIISQTFRCMDYLLTIHLSNV